MNGIKNLSKALIAKQQQTMLVVGDVLDALWGYEQSNYSYFQVTRLLGKRTVEIREIAQLKQETGWLQGDCVPVKNKYIGEPMIKRVNAEGGIKIKSYMYATKKESIVVMGRNFSDLIITPLMPNLLG